MRPFFAESRIVFIFLIIVSFCHSCKKEGASDIPVILTSPATEIKTTTAFSGGVITSDGGDSVSVRGVCWSTSINPTIEANKTIDGSGTGTFVSTLTGLVKGTTYFLRAYATNDYGTAYGNELIITTDEIHFSPNLTYGTVTDIDGNIYKTLQKGNYIWMAENLKTTRFNDGSEIPLITDDLLWSSYEIPRYCWYGNESGYNKDILGALYNWPAVYTAKLCPTGWHVPARSEWYLLILSADPNARSDMHSPSDIAAGPLKEVSTVHWLSPNAGATNVSGFTAVPAGRRDRTGLFSGIGETATWWMSGNESITIFFDDEAVYGSEGAINQGRSVRCVKN